MMRYLLLICLVSCLSAHDNWTLHKQETLQQMHHLDGWCTDEKADALMELIKENRCLTCVEIGVLAGRSLLPIAKALQYNKAGHLFAIDAWSANEAIAGYPDTDLNYSWWGQLDYNLLQKNAMDVVTGNRLSAYCSLVHMPSLQAAEFFKDGSIDFIHFDGSHQREYALKDVMAFFPKIREGGTIILNDAAWYALQPALVYLLERTDMRGDFSSDGAFIVLQKNSQKAERAKEL